MHKKILCLIFSILLLSQLAIAQDVDEPETKWNLRFKITHMVERFYDDNADGYLTDLEVLYLLRDVMNAVRRKGRFEVFSPILKTYDENHNGWIDNKEADMIESFLY